ncbi:MAG TPA: heme-binding protein [Nitrospirales bacterium]|nr:heme-binding protein [Nitrospirales bacterium]
MIGKKNLQSTSGKGWYLSGIITLSLSGLFIAGVWAAELPREAVLPLSLATKAASAAVEQCTKDGYQVSAAVVDRAGVVRALLREDGAGPHTVDSSRKKAYTSASLKRPTAELGELIAKMPAVQALRDMNENMLILGGGLPIEIGGEVVGGIGVGGAPGGHLDAACAQAGLETIGAASKRPKDK